RTDDAKLSSRNTHCSGAQEPSTVKFPLFGVYVHVHAYLPTFGADISRKLLRTRIGSHREVGALMRSPVTGLWFASRMSPQLMDRRESWPKERRRRPPRRQTRPTEP